MLTALRKILGIVIIAASFIVGWLLMDMRTFMITPLNIPDAGYNYTIAPNTTLKRFAYDLDEAGVLTHPGYLILLARWNELSGRIKAGEYHFSQGITPERLLQQVIEGKVVQHSLTVVEGWTFRQLMDAIRKDEKLIQTLHALDDASIMARLGLPERHPEGLFYPDTYYFLRDTTDLEFLERAYRTMERRLMAEWESRAEDLPLQTPYEALILASIIERETALPQERTQIAGVFIRRLKRGMPLQTDPTVIYGLGEAFDGNLRRRDLVAESPYNTYRIKGLPPTPIALPHGDSIHAALHPTDGDAIFFVSRGDGSHEFSATLVGHNDAVRKFQLNKNAP
ncbi:MAG: hypothetical protein FD165_285 [Gammaproteobacteria bacterium]|nr:MAG: hypothetical protein FD165_285 [Gammaproteobacteria bacterium]TND06864.1 MAG: UPF0755 protein [Gammaproteobacteria bacterium]